MPLIQLDTSCDLSTSEKKQFIAKELSSLASVCIGKPEQYVMATVRDNVVMAMGGVCDPAALVSVKSIGGLNRDVNRKLAADVSRMLQQKLDIAGDRIYLTFEEFPRTHWARNSDTFG
ncbi:MAG: phenylpyruvate tautomerase MIF-related protein [Kiritimatiellia bacterium]